jgi:3-hydroxyacyl-CoA dehydrogenase
VRWALDVPIDEALRRERDTFMALLAGDQSKAQRHIFFAEREAAKVPGVAKGVVPHEIKRAAVIGAGTMGGGIAMCFANAGIPVTVIETAAEALKRGQDTIAKNYKTSVSRGSLGADEMERRLARFTGTTDIAGVADADIVIEAVFEEMGIKKQVFGNLDRLAKPGAVLATNTSYLNVNEIAQMTKRPASVLGTHFFSPANVMRLVEIVRGAVTGKSVVATALALAKRLGKVGVVVGNCRGFVGNRMMLPYMREAQFLAEEGATPEQVDAALYDFGMAMGIFAVDDMGGIDVGWRVRQEYKHLDKPGVRVPLVLDKLYHMNRLGQKTGAGWYRYGGDRKPIPDPEVDALIEKTALEAGIPRRSISAEEIVERCIYTLVNEGARILDEGYAQRAADIDVIYMTGYGFPAYRGGPMWYADTVGLKNVYQRVREFHERFGELWEPAPLLKRLAESGETFAEHDLHHDGPNRENA